MKISILGAGRVFGHYLDNVFDKYFVENNDISIFSNSYAFKPINNGFNYLSKIEDIVSIKPDCVIILTPSGLHYEHTKYFLDNKINVLCEKPLTLRLSQLNELLKLSKKNNLIFAPVFQNRFNPTICKVKDIISENLIGRIRLASVKLHWSREQLYYEDKWHGRWKTDGGVISQQAIHHIDTLIFLNGKINKVSSFMANLENNLEAEDTHIALMQHNNGSIGTLEATTAVRPHDKEALITLVGDKGYIEIGGIALNKIERVVLNNSEKENELIEASFNVPNGYGTSHNLLVADFLSSIRNNTEPFVTVESSIDTHKSIHALYRSSESNGLWCDVASDLESSYLGK